MKYLLALITAFSLTGCVVYDEHPPRAYPYGHHDEGKHHDRDHDYNPYHQYPYPGHCPPGQAKKGRC